CAFEQQRLGGSGVQRPLRWTNQNEFHPLWSENLRSGPGAGSRIAGPKTGAGAIRIKNSRRIAFFGQHTADRQRGDSSPGPGADRLQHLFRRVARIKEAVNAISINMPLLTELSARGAARPKFV